MPKKNKNKNNRPIILFLLSFILVLSGAYYFAVFRKDKPGLSNTDEVASSDNEVSSVIEPPEDSSSSIDVEKKDKTPVKYDGEDPNSLDGITGLVTYSGINNDNLVVRVNIDQFLNSGECKISVGTFSESVKLIPNASTSTCEGFDIPLSSLSDEGGEYKFVIELSSGDKTGTIEGSISK